MGPEMDRHTARWRKPLDKRSWSVEVEVMRRFAQERQPVMSVSNSIASDPNEAPTAMLKFLREHWQLFLIMVLWLLTGMYLNQAVFRAAPAVGVLLQIA